MNNVNAVPAKRSFNYNGMQLEDPDPSMPPEKVIEFHALLHAELTNATVKGPSAGGDGTQNYQVEVQIGDFN